MENIDTFSLIIGAVLGYFVGMLVAALMIGFLQGICPKDGE